MAESVNEPEPAKIRCAQKAVELLARRPHFRRQLEDKLRKRGFREPDISEACEDLEQRGYLDDLECARSLVTGSLRRKGFGPRRVRAELQRRGAANAAVDQAVAEAFEAEGEGPRVRETAGRWLRTREWDSRRLASHLERKGFSSGAIAKALRELAPAAGDRGSDRCN